MTFNSIPYLLFLPLVFSLFWLLQCKGVRWQNCFLLVASYVFYGWWDWRYLGLVLLSTVVDFSIGIWLDREENDKKRRKILFISLFLNLGMLFFFKYFGFFTVSFAELMQQFGWHVDELTLKIILPVGISFYTFQNLSYTVDVYRKKVAVTRDFWAFAAFVTFFPQLVAGPIERAANLLPQFLRKRTFDAISASIGCRLILWGLFKKVVMADNLSAIVRPVFESPNDQNIWTVLLGTLCFAIQIYGDFSGYSDIARGSARLFGFDLMQNFRIPYQATSLRDFWLRWHISLSGWFRDYVYVPLGGNRNGTALLIRNLLVTFALSGLWHGANWTYLIWGLWHGLMLVLETLMRTLNSNWNTDDADLADKSGFWGISTFPKLLKFRKRCWVLGVVGIGWIFFRANNLSDAMALLSKLGRFSDDLGALSTVFSIEKSLALLLCIVLVFVVESRSNGEPEKVIGKCQMPIRWTIYCFLVAMIMLLGAFSDAPMFIYFQF
jgi:alginate O-acetyltransferase complex protein AlgI